MKAAVVPPPAIGPHQWYYVKMEFRDTDPGDDHAALELCRTGAIASRTRTRGRILTPQSATWSVQDVTRSTIGRLLSSPA